MVGYIRVSSADQAAHGVSLDEQRTRIKGYATAHGLELAAVEADEGISGKSVEQRPALLRALQRLRKGRATGLVVVKLDRLSRSLRDALDLVARSEREGWQLHSISENLDTSTPHGRFVVHLFAALAQLEREQIGERTRNGMAELRRQGKRISPAAAVRVPIRGPRARAGPSRAGNPRSHDRAPSCGLWANGDRAGAQCGWDAKPADGAGLDAWECECAVTDRGQTTGLRNP